MARDSGEMKTITKRVTDDNNHAKFGNLELRIRRLENRLDNDVYGIISIIALVFSIAAFLLLLYLIN